jgi:hypothetical protein
MKDAGIVNICDLINEAADGEMPKEKLQKLRAHLFEERIIGYGRQYAAKGVNERVDMQIRVWRDAQVHIGQYALLSDYEGQVNPDGDQYRIDNVQQVLDSNGLKVTDLTLYRMDELYEVINADS